MQAKSLRRCAPLALALTWMTSVGVANAVVEPERAFHSQKPTFAVHATEDEQRRATASTDGEQEQENDGPHAIITDLPPPSETSNDASDDDGGCALGARSVRTPRTPAFMSAMLVICLLMSRRVSRETGRREHADPSVK